MDKIFLSYVAGLMDGEGSIGIYRTNHGTYVFRVQFVQNRYPESERVIGTIVKTFGGTAHLYKAPSGRSVYRWTIYSLAAARFLGLIYPYLKLKRKQAHVAIKWAKNHPIIRCRDAKGRIMPHSNDRRKDYQVSQKLKKMKLSPLQ